MRDLRATLAPRLDGHEHDGRLLVALCSAARVTLRVNVAGGTGAGSRIVKPAATSWVHVCRDKPTDGGVLLEASFTRCPACGTRRPR